MAAAQERAARWCPTCRARYRADFARCPVDGGVLEERDRDPLIGERIGAHYVIDEFIGEGAMARVYRAHHAVLEHKRFALKVMVGDLAATMEMRLRFAQEADAVSQLHHPNVVSVVDFGKTEHGLVYIAMELVEGRSLAQLIAKEAPLAPTRALALARQIALGLGHAHDCGLVHRDLKPDNIIISTNPEMVRIVDFGLAIPIDDEVSTRLTGIGLAVGTPLYAAPEQCMCEPTDHRADLYALGVTLYEMLAGVVPFEGSIVELVQRKIHDVIIPIAARSGVQVPPDIEAIARKLLRRSPGDRFSTAHELVEAIDAVSRDPSAAMTVVSLPAQSAMPAAPWRRRLVLGVAAIAVLAIVSLGVVMAVGDRESTKDSPVATTIAGVRQPSTPPRANPEKTAGRTLPEVVTAELPSPPSPSSTGSQPSSSTESQPSAPTSTSPAESTSTSTSVSTTKPSRRPRPPSSPTSTATSSTRPASTSTHPSTSATSATTPPPSPPTTAPTDQPSTSAANPPPAPAATDLPSPTSSTNTPSTAATDHPSSSSATKPPASTAATSSPTSSSNTRPQSPSSPLWTTATVRVASLQVRGSLSSADVAPGISRAAPALSACYKRAATGSSTSPAVTVRVSLSFDDSRRASNVHASSTWSVLTACVASVAEGLRIPIVPDVGTVDVVVDFAFQPTGP